MSNNNSILLIDPDFDPATSLNCSLIVKMGYDSFSYAIINKEKNKVIAVFDEQECEDVVKKLTDKIKTDSYLGLNFNDVKIASYSANLINIPTELYSEESLEANAQYFAEPHDGNLHVQAQPYFKFNSIFAFDKKTSAIFENFKDAKIYHESAGLLNLATTATDGLFLDFTVGSFSALFVKNGKVIFQKSYDIENTDEFNYYLLLIKNQLQITEETSIKLSGIIHEKDQRHNVISKYFTKTTMLLPQSDLALEALEDMPSHYYTTLLAIYKCV